MSVPRIPRLQPWGARQTQPIPGWNTRNDTAALWIIGGPLPKANS